MRSFGIAAAILPTSPIKCWVSAGSSRRDWCRQRDLKFDPSRDDAVALQSLEQLPRRDRHVGITGLERGRVWSRAGFDAQARNFTQKLAVPLGEFERWHLGGDLDRRVVGEHLLQKSDPGFADTGLAVGQTPQVRPGGFRQSAKYGFPIGQRDAADKMCDRGIGASFRHGVLLKAVLLARSSLFHLARRPERAAHVVQNMGGRSL